MPYLAYLPDYLPGFEIKIFHSPRLITFLKNGYRTQSVRVWNQSCPCLRLCGSTAPSSALSGATPKEGSPICQPGDAPQRRIVPARGVGHPHARFRARHWLVTNSHMRNSGSETGGSPIPTCEILSERLGGYQFPHARFWVRD